MKVLIACEFSGTVRDAFIKAGHDAMSCDLVPTDIPGPHYQGSVLDILNDGWDLMIAHPPCTHLAASGARHFAKKIADGRQQQGIDFFMTLANCNIPKYAIENPVGIMSNKWRKPDQIINPWEYGHSTTKATCLWLKGLPLLRHTKFVEPRVVDGKNRWGNQCDSGQNKLGPSDDRWKERSRTYQGIANAMAEQWG